MYTSVNGRPSAKPTFCGPQPEGAEIDDLRVTLPAGAVLIESIQRNGTLKGMVGVYWEGRHYSVFLRDLLHRTERISVA